MHNASSWVPMKVANIASDFYEVYKHLLLGSESHVLTLADLHFQISALNNDQQINNDHSTKKVLAGVQAGLNMLAIRDAMRS